MTGLEDDAWDILRKARFGLGRSIDEVARSAGIESGRLQEIEAGAVASAGELERLANALSLRAAPLLAIAIGRYQPPPTPQRFGAWTVTPVFAEDVGAYCYAVTSGDARFAVDAGGGAGRIRDALGGPPEAVLLTHGHRDHVAALGEFSAPALAHPDLAREVGGRQLADGEAALSLRALYCPGHSADMLTFAGPGFAFVGDTLFAGSLGRAMSPGRYTALIGSAKRILALPKETVLFCGHGPATTVASELEHNAFPIDS